MDAKELKAKEKILQAADRLFGQVGFDATTTRDIAEVSGVNKALIHYHFRSKKGLLTSLLDAYYKDLGDTLAGVLAGEGDFRKRMFRLVDAYLDFLREHHNFARIVQREATGGKNLPRIQSHMAPLFALGTQVVSEAFPSTQKGDLSAAHLLISFYGMVISYFTYSDILEELLGEDPLSDKRFADRKRHLRQMINIVLDAVVVQERAAGDPHE